MDGGWRGCLTVEGSRRGGVLRWELCMGRGENVEAVLGCEVGGCWFFFFALPLGGVLFCELFDFDAVVMRLCSRS